jgi:hypothetical protein
MILKDNFLFFENLSEKRSLIFYPNIKLLLDRKYYVMCGSRNDKRETAWFRTGIWKLRGMRKSFGDWKMPPM